MTSKTEQKLEKNHVKNIIKKIFKGESHRPYLLSLKTQEKLKTFVDLIEKIDKKKNKNTSDLFSSGYLDDATIDEKCWHLGIAKKTIGDTYGSQSKDAIQLGIEELEPLIDDLFKEVSTSLGSVEISFNNNHENINRYKILPKDFYKILLAVSTRSAALSGGFNSTFGKSIEKPLMITLCKIFQLGRENYYAHDLKDEGGFSRETDFYIIDDLKNKHKVEMKMMGKGNPEGADSIYARGTKVFVGDTLSETNKKQCDSVGVLWLELRKNGWTKFSEILDHLNISNKFNNDYERELDKIIDEAYFEANNFYS